MPKKQYKSIFLICLVFILLSISGMVYASDTYVDLTKKGSLSLTFSDSSGSHQLLTNGSIQIFKVAEVCSENSNLAYYYTEDFKDCKLSIGDINKAESAMPLSHYADQKGLTGTVKIINGSGNVLFEDLPLGLYLVRQKDPSSGYYPITPFVVSIPMTSEDGTSWIYDIDASPKTEHRPYIPEDETTTLTVTKRWNSEDDNHPQSVTVQLLCDGQYYNLITLGAENNWTHTWYWLNASHQWDVVETQVPEDYTVSYSQTGTTITITNSKVPDIPKEPTELTVKKIWKTTAGKDHPQEAKIQLWNGNALYETVTLNAANDWCYLFKDLPKSNDWEIREVEIPKDYTVSYQTNGTVITITNTLKEDTPEEPTVTPTPTEPEEPTPEPEGPTPEPKEPPLVQTGQLNWPIPVLTISGILLFVCGWILIFTKRGRHEEK